MSRAVDEAKATADKEDDDDDDDDLIAAGSDDCDARTAEVFDVSVRDEFGEE